MKNQAALFISLSLVIGIYIFSNIVIVAEKKPEGDNIIDSQIKKSVIDTLSKDLIENYVFPEIAKKMDQDIKARWDRKEYDKITNGEEFAKTLTEHLQAISKDKHLRVTYSERPIPVRVEREEPTDQEKAEYLAFMKERNFGFQKVEILSGNIGYVDLRGFTDPESGAKTVESAMNFLANTEALIFDVRKNGGGDPEMVALISSYLFGDKPVHLNDLYWRKGDVTNEFWTKPQKANVKFEGKDVYVLTSNRTFSAAEEFSYNLKNLKRATIVGETTGGGAHPGGSFRLGEHFSAFISTGRAISPITKTNWEGKGVEPDIKISKEEALDKAYLLALQKLLEKTDDARMKRSLEKLIDEKKKDTSKPKEGVAKRSVVVF